METPHRVCRPVVRINIVLEEASKPITVSFLMAESFEGVF
jgi:hypothetical protein